MSYQGWKKPLTVDDLYELNESDTTDSIASKFERYCKPSGWAHASRKTYVKALTILMSI